MILQPKNKEEKPKHAVNFLPPPKLSHAEIRKQVYKRLNEHNYTGLRQDIALYKLTDEQISDFFLKEGSKLLIWSLTSASPEGALQLWVDVVPKDTFMSVLSKDDFSILKEYLEVQLELERKNRQTEEEKKDQIKVFSILLSVDAHAISSFMKENANNISLVSEKIKSNFSTALLQLAESASSPAAPGK
jgi:hypothetical protein